MSKCNFSIPFTGTATELKTKAETAITNAGGIFDGNTLSGNFSLPTPLGEIKGTYIMNDASPIQVEIIQKPVFVTCHQIETKLNGYLNPITA